MYGSAEWRARGPLRSDEIVSVVLGTAGHIDHGKTSLVRALSGVDADRLKEERERGDRAVALVRERLERGPAIVSDLRVALDASRRHAVALLERLDRQGITRREGNVRTLKGASR